MEKYEIPIETTLTVTSEDIDDIMCTALEGGITYWCDAARPKDKYLGQYVHEQISKGGTLILYNDEYDEKYELTREKLLNGIANAHIEGLYPTYFWCNGSILDTCNVDAEVADTIIQYALFNEIVFD